MNICPICEKRIRVTKEGKVCIKSGVEGGKIVVTCYHSGCYWSREGSVPLETGGD